MYRLAMLLALVIALAAVGCGGSGDDNGSEPAAAEQSRDSSASVDDSASNGDEKKKTKTNADEKTSEDDDEADDDDELKTEEEITQEQEEAYEELPLKRKTALIETVVGSAVSRFGLKLVDIEVTDRGHGATAVVARKGACNFVASQEPNLMLTIQHAAPGLKSVRFEVAGTGEELGYYVVGCKKPEIPSGAGRVVLNHSGVGGPYKSKRFKITTKHWALEWANDAASLAVIVEAVAGESKGEYFKPVGSQKREAHRFDYTGRGTFQIKAYGAGGWQVRVKEIR